MIRPIRPPTAAPVRLFAPAVFVATPGETIRPLDVLGERENCCGR